MFLQWGAMGWFCWSDSTIRGIGVELGLLEEIGDGSYGENDSIKYYVCVYMDIIGNVSTCAWFVLAS